MRKSGLPADRPTEREGKDAAFIAAWLLPRLGFGVGGTILWEIIDAAIGAIVLLVVIRLIRGVV